MGVDIDPGQLKKDLITHAAHLLQETDANAALKNPTVSDEVLGDAILTLKIVRKELKLARRLGKQFPTSLVLLDTTDTAVAVEPSTPTAEIPAEIPQLGEDTQNPPARSMQEEFIIILLERADRGEDQNLHSVARDFYERRSHNPSKNPDKALGGITGGLFRARNAIIEKLPYPKNASTQKLLAAAHTVPGHEQMTEEELLVVLIKNRNAERSADATVSIGGTIFTRTSQGKNDDEGALSKTATERTTRLETPTQTTREEKIFLAYLEPDENGNFKNNSLADIVKKAYESELAGLEEKKLRAEITRYKNTVTVSRINFIAKLRAIANHQIESPCTLEVLETAKKLHPAYADLTVEEFIALIKRNDLILKDGKLINPNPIDLSVGIGQAPSEDPARAERVHSTGILDSLKPFMVDGNPQSPTAPNGNRVRRTTADNSSEGDKPTRETTAIATSRNRIPFFPSDRLNLPEEPDEEPTTSASAADTEPTRSLMPDFAVPEPKKIKSQLEVFEANYGNKRTLVFDSLIGRGDSGDNFRFVTTDEANQFVYQKALAKINRSSVYLRQAADIKHAFCVTREWHVQTLVDYIKDPEGPSKETAESLLQQAASGLGFENGDMPSAIRLIKILRRHIKFEDIHGTNLALDKVTWSDDRETLFTSEVNIAGPGDKKANGEETENDKREPITLHSGQSSLAAAYRDSRRSVVD